MTPWIIEAVLELTGAVLAWRKRLDLLAALLAFRFLADVVTHLMLLGLGGNAYGVALWLGLGVQYVLLVWLTVQLLRELLLERHRPLAPYAVVFSVLVGVIVGLVSVQGETLAERFKAGGIAANATIGMILALGWIWRTVGLSKTSQGVAAGLVVTFFSNGLCTFLWMFWAGAPKLYPAGQILTLIIWNLVSALAKAEPREFPALRLSLGPRVPDRTMWLDRSAEEQVN